MIVKVRESGEIEVSVRDRSSPGNRMVAELMILCNSLLARFCAENGLPAVYRSQRPARPVGPAGRVGVRRAVRRR